MGKEKRLLPQNPGNANPVAQGIEPLKPSIAVRMGFFATSGKVLASFFSLSEPLWAIAAAIWVNLSYLLQMKSGFIWLGLAILFIPFILRLWRGGYAAVRTPFDLPLALLILGAAIGLRVSSQREISWGAFYSLLADTLGYYSLVHYRYPGALIKIGFSLGSLALLLATLFAFGGGFGPGDSLLWTSSWDSWVRQHLPQLPQPSSQPNLTIGASHGLPLLLLIAVAIYVGLAAFGKRAWLRLITGFGALLFLGIIVLLTNASLIRLFTQQSIMSRIPLWQWTLHILRSSPITGMGLGMWAYIQNSGIVPPQHGATHPHNAYLQLYFDTGMLGPLALLIALVIGVRLSWQVLKAPRASPWYGLGPGITLAVLFTALVGMVESAPAGVPVVGTEAYFYILSPIPWVLSTIMVLAYRLLKEQSQK